MLILISDAFDDSLPKRLEELGEVTTDKSRLSEAEVVLIRSKTKCTKEYLDSAPRAFRAQDRERHLTVRAEGRMKPPHMTTDESMVR